MSLFKKLLSIAAVLAIVLSICVLGIGTVASAAEESPEEDFLVYDGVLEEYIGAGGDIVIPASLGVTEIAAQSFYRNDDITSLVLPEGVETIGSKAFSGCSNLASITLPYSLEELAEHEFSGCAITEITIPGNLEVISYGCFSGCEFLTELNLSYGVKEILVLAFQGTSIEKVVFPETVELICGGSSFGHNKNAEIGKIEYYICNPDCEIGSDVTGSRKASKHEWTGVSTPWSHNKGNAQYRIYVIEGSEVDKFLTEQGEELLRKVDSGKQDGFKIFRKDEQFFKDLPENQKTYGIQAPTSETPSTGVDTPVDDPNAGGDVDKTDGDKKPSTNNQNGTQGGTQTIIQGSNSNTGNMLIIIICVFGGIMLIAIIAVVILLATGKIGGAKKPEAPAPVDDVEALKAKLEAAELRAKLEALEKSEADVEAPAEDAE